MQQPERPDQVDSADDDSAATVARLPAAGPVAPGGGDGDATLAPAGRGPEHGLDEGATLASPASRAPADDGASTLASLAVAGNIIREPP